MKAHFTEQPGSIMYMPLPKGGADVWLRKNIAEEHDDEGNTFYTADEVYFRTNEPKETIEADFEEYFSGNLPHPPAPKISDAERIAALEAAVLDLAEVMANG